MTAAFSLSEPTGIAVVGLDLSLRCTGIAYATGETAVIETDKLRGIPRLRVIRDFVRQALDVSDRAPDLVVIEGYSFGSPQGMAALGELGGVIRMVLADEADEHPSMGWAVVQPSSLKKYATGKGNSDKTAMVVAARERLGYTGLRHDEADAAWLRALGLDLLGAPMVTLPEVNRSAMKAVDVVKVPEP